MKPFTGGPVPDHLLRGLANAGMRAMCEHVLGPNGVAVMQEHMLAQHRRFDVGHEIVLPERARSDHR